MTDLQKIESSPELQMKLSEMLFKLLWKGECWHEYDPHTFCRYCQTGKLLIDCPTIKPNPNLFNSWEGFGKVWEVVKDREDWQAHFMLFKPYLIHTSFIATPHFQLEVLMWLLEQEGRLGELEEKIGGEEDE